MEIVTFCFKMTLYGKAEHAFLIGRCVYVHIKLVFFVLLHAVAEYNQIFCDTCNGEPREFGT